MAAFPDLRKLVFAGSEALDLDLSVLERLPRLAWLGFPQNTTQEAFARVIASHPDLKVVELGSEKVRDLSPLRSLPASESGDPPAEKRRCPPASRPEEPAVPRPAEDAFEGDATEKTAGPWRRHFRIRS